MCLSVKIDRPDAVLAEGVHAGLEWIVTHNEVGNRCGYVRIPKGHPWHGAHYDHICAEVHGGLTFAEPDEPCDAGGADDAWWIGFDCAHSGDAPDPDLPSEIPPELLGLMRRAQYGTVRTQKYVEAECRSLCEQAAAVGV